MARIQIKVLVAVLEADKWEGTAEAEEWFELEVPNGQMTAEVMANLPQLIAQARCEFNRNNEG